MGDPAIITDFAELLEVEAVASDLFRASTPGQGGHLFGGLTFALATRAASLTVDADRLMHAATCQFVGAGSGGSDLDIAVERVRDGRTLSLRRVRVEAEGQLLFSCDTWFAPDATGQDWQPEGPENDLAGATEPVAPLDMLGIDPLEVRSTRSAHDVAGLHIQPYWARSRHPIGENRSLNLGALAFLSDLCAVGLVNVPGVAPDALMSDYQLSLNHSLWVHRPFTLDRWLRVDGGPLSIHGARGLATGTIHAEDGSLVATFAQESLRRP